MKCKNAWVVICCIFGILFICETMKCPSDLSFKTLDTYTQIDMLTFFSEKGIGLLLCAKRCLRYAFCDGISYSIQDLECRLNYDENATSVKMREQFNGYLNVKRNSITQHLENACSHRICSKNETCIVLKSGNTACIPFYNNFRFLGDIAYLKETEQSSFYSSFHASSRAVDGNLNQILAQGGCSRTLQDQRPWLQVDLSRPCTILKVTVRTTKNCCSSQLRNFGLFVGLQKHPDNLVSYYEGEAGAEPINFTYRYPVIGRFLKIMIFEEEALILCEVEASGYYTMVY